MGGALVMGYSMLGGAAVANQHKVIWAQALDHGVSTQRDEIIALT